ncbi:MAG: MBL fold metallo-hydrolase [Oscillospiraceae bacterium]|nr:MBL fold metallo-hydrolase [Oscillospiraceae bacterium]
MRILVLGSMQNNCYIITDEASGETAVIDPGEFSAELEELGAKGVKYILLTHGHFDHIGGVDELRELTGAQVAVSKADALLMKDSSINGGRLFSAKSGVCAEPDLILNDGDIITLGQLKIKVIATPGHTAGGLCFLCEGSLFSGDTLFYHECGRWDFATGSQEQMLESLKLLSKLPPETKVYPGHDIESTIGEERLHNPYINR